jgi:hypothetical protein
MDINPISPIRPVGMIKPTATTPDLSRVFEVEYLGQSDDEYTSGDGKSARGLEDEEEDVSAENQSDNEERPEAVVQSTKISFFA